MLRIALYFMIVQDIPEDERLFGRFICNICEPDNEWGSAYAWKGYYQECKICKSEVYTWDFNLL